MYIYFHNTDYVVGGRTITQSKRYYDTYYKDLPMSYDEYISDLKKMSYSRF